VWYSWIYRYKQAFPILMKGLHRLEYRGYDSAGVALINGDLKIYKKAGKVTSLAEYARDKDTQGTTELAIPGGQPMGSPTT
jgi:glucosamine--fructose-6-phosphate aminotransferase (isomerizing)